MSLIRRVAVRMVPSAMMAHAMGSVAIAQTPATLPGEDGGWLQWLVGVGVVVVIVITGFLNPKRSHLT